jgi:chromosome segregation ATPase
MQIVAFTTSGTWSFDASGVALSDLRASTVIIGKNNSGKSNVDLPP